MLGFSPFKKRANKFNYTPRYYDPDVEAFRDRRREKSGESDERNTEHKEGYVAGEYIRRQREARYERRGQESSDRKRRNMLGMVIVAVFIAVVVFLLLPRVVRYMELKQQVESVEQAPAEDEFDPYRPIRVVPNDYQGE